MVSLVMKLPGDRTEPRKLLETLHVPKLLFNLVSVLKVSERGRVICLLEGGCEIIDSHDKVIKYGSLFLLDCQTSEQMKVAKM